MLFIYYLSDGEIYQASRPEKNMQEYFGYRADEMSKIYGALYVDGYNDFIFYNFDKFKVEDGQLVYKEQKALNNFLKKA